MRKKMKIEGFWIIFDMPVKYLVVDTFLVTFQTGIVTCDV